MSDKQGHRYDLDHKDHQELTQPGRLPKDLNESSVQEIASQDLISKTIALDNSTVNRFGKHCLHPAIWIGGSFAAVVCGLYYLIYANG
ncbi:MAG: hypothetical protein EOP12_00590 [Pseudomonas sp.]|nr:MAG: hypothetical protein EOP12_00590 [Pseudomonas sp.]